MSETRSELSHFTTTTHCHKCWFGSVPVTTGENGEQVEGECPDCRDGRRRLKDITLPNGARFIRNNRIRKPWKIVKGKYQAPIGNPLVPLAMQPIVAVEVSRGDFTAAEVQAILKELAG